MVEPLSPPFSAADLLAAIDPTLRVHAARWRLLAAQVQPPPDAHAPPPVWLFAATPAAVVAAHAADERLACVPAPRFLVELCAGGAAAAVQPPHADSVVVIAPGWPNAAAARFAAAADEAARQALFPAAQFVLA